MTDEELFQILNRKRKANWIGYREILKHDGWYYMSPNWYHSLSETKTIANFHLHKYTDKQGNLSPFFTVIEIRNGKPVRFGNNMNPAECEIEKFEELEPRFNYRYLFLAK